MPGSFRWALIEMLIIAMMTMGFTLFLAATVAKLLQSFAASFVFPHIFAGRFSNLNVVNPLTSTCILVFFLFHIFALLDSRQSFVSKLYCAKPSR